MKKIFALMLTMAALALPVWASSLDDAHAAFAAGKYEESAQGYQSVLDARGYSAPVLYDLGNADYLEGKYPEAILAYKRALVLAPSDDDIRANLRMAQQQAGILVEHAPGYTKITGILSVNAWAWMASAAWTLLCGCLLLRVAFPARGALLAVAAVVCAFVLLDAIGAIVLSSGGLRDAVVIDKNPQALVSPFPGAQSVFTPTPGETVKIEKAYNDFLLVADASGHAGWMAKGQIEPVVR